MSRIDPHDSSSATGRQSELDEAGHLEMASRTIRYVQELSASENYSAQLCKDALIKMIEHFRSENLSQSALQLLEDHLRTFD